MVEWTSKVLEEDKVNIKALQRRAKVPQAHCRRSVVLMSAGNGLAAG